MEYDAASMSDTSPAPASGVGTTGRVAVTTRDHDDDVLVTLKQIVSDVLKLAPDQITTDAALTDFPHVESIKLLRIAGKVERRFDIELENEALFRRGTLGDLAQEIVKVRDHR